MVETLFGLPLAGAVMGMTSIGLGAANLGVSVANRQDIKRIAGDTRTIRNNMATYDMCDRIERGIAGNSAALNQHTQQLNQFAPLPQNQNQYQAAQYNQQYPTPPYGVQQQNPYAALQNLCAQRRDDARLSAIEESIRNLTRQQSLMPSIQTPVIPPYMYSQPQQAAAPTFTQDQVNLIVQQLAATMGQNH